MLMNSSEYLDLVQNIKQEIQHAQYRAALSVNKELIMLYYNIGQMINEHKTWGSKFIDNLAADIKLSFPEAKGYSVRNLKYMAKLAATYPEEQFVQRAVAQIPWGHPLSWQIRWCFYKELSGQDAGKQTARQACGRPKHRRNCVCWKGIIDRNQGQIQT